MAELSYPVLGASVSETQWRVMAQNFAGNGVINMGGDPYRVVSRTDGTNTILIGRDTVTGFAEGMIRGFTHRMDTDKGLVVPTAAGTYHVGLVFDPAGYGTSAGPVTLALWTAPGDFTNNKARVVLWEIVRAASQALSAATLIDKRQYIAPEIRILDDANKPRYQELPVNTELVNMANGNRWRNSGSAWVEVFTGNQDVANATLSETPGTIMKRSDDTGIVRANTAGAHPMDLINREYANNRFALASHSHSWSSITSKPSSYPPSGHSHDASAINSGTLSYARVNGSNHAYNNTNTGTTWASVVARNTGEFARYPSALKYKVDITDWRPTVEDVLAMNPVHYFGKESGDEHIGIVADYHAGTSIDLLVQYGASEENEPTDEVEGFHYFLMPVAQQIVLRNHEDRVKALEKQVEELTALVRGLIEQK